MTKLMPLRKFVIGLACAIAISFGTAKLHAFGCSASVMCTWGDLMGLEIQCECMGSGECHSFQSGGVTCACDGFPQTLCHCGEGCRDI